MKTLKDLEFEGKRVLLRTDYNVPIDNQGNILDDFRIKLSLPTINHILEKKPAQLIILSHFGRPKNNEEFLRTDKIAARLSELINQKVTKINAWRVNSSSPVVMLENTRFNPAEKSKEIEKRDDFGKMLAEQADIYVNDAFANCHRDHATMTSIPKYIPGCIGLNIEKELEMLQQKLENPEKPFVSVIGGLKADKTSAIKNLLSRSDYVLLGGAIAFLFLKLKGYEVGQSKIDLEGCDQSNITTLLANPKLILPIDCVVANEISQEAKSEIVNIDAIPSNMMALDIGPKTAKLYSEKLEGAKTVVWNGPIGVFEIPTFAQGTKAIAEAVAKPSICSIIGGGDSAAAVKKLGFADNVTHISSGGGASLILIEGKQLVALEALEK